ncbi:MAG: hypothetical protein HKO68_07180 [Desulfobacterales bacterium]|nr:hypothetical protein [Desulfobacterales bacterium]
MAQYFLQSGFENVYVLQGGWSAWQKAGYRLDNK